MKKINISEGPIEGKERLKLYFDYDREVIELIKTIPGARWHPGERCWHVSVLAGPVEKLNRLFEGKLLFELDKGTGRQGDGKDGRWNGGRPISPIRDVIMVEKEGDSTKESCRDGTNHGKQSGDRTISQTGDLSFERNARIELVPSEFIKTLTLKNYAQNTIRTYKTMLQEFLEYYKDLDPGKITGEQIRDYLLYLLDKRKISISYQNQSINAIKFYYEQVLGRPVRTYYIQRPKKPKVLPNVLSEEEVQMILNKMDNLKHKCIISLAYSAGLRLGEVINLKPGDIDSKRNYVIVRQGKGMKDRYSLLSGRILELLRKYYAEYKPKEWLFEGQFGGPYSATSIHAILKSAVEKAGIKKRVTVHTLRHSFATHLLERGTDIRYIQELLGHQSSRTTEIYTHMTQKGLGKIKSPLDNLDI
ncbi:MAG TPA: site-specific integrase [Bacteroidales bacterium]|nr:site-specific integrase [Bacteroidales bacterium]HOX77867.1 site-specific integrase [Bacteroidales bacterium]